MIPADSPLPAASPAPSRFAPPSGDDFAELVKTVRSLRFLFNLALIVLALLALMLNLFMASQVHTMRRQAGELLPAVREMQNTLSDYESNSVPVMQRFTLDLRRFAERNPDFAPILNRYAGAIPAGRPTNAPAPAAVPQSTNK